MRVTLCSHGCVNSLLSSCNHWDHLQRSCSLTEMTEPVLNPQLNLPLNDGAIPSSHRRRVVLCWAELLPTFFLLAGEAVFAAACLTRLAWWLISWGAPLPMSGTKMRTHQRKGWSRSLHMCTRWATHP